MIGTWEKQHLVLSAESSSYRGTTVSRKTSKRKPEKASWRGTVQEKAECIPLYHAHEGIRLDPWQSRSLMSDQDHVQLRAGQVRQQLNKFQVKEIVDHVAFHKFLDLDRHDIRYLSSPTEDKVEEHYKQQEERCKAITEPEHICPLLHHLLCTRLHLYEALELLGKHCLYYDADSISFISRPGKTDPLLGDIFVEFKD